MSQGYASRHPVFECAGFAESWNHPRFRHPGRLFHSRFGRIYSDTQTWSSIPPLARSIRPLFIDSRRDVDSYKISLSIVRGPLGSIISWCLFSLFCGSL